MPLCGRRKTLSESFFALGRKFPPLLADSKNAMTSDALIWMLLPVFVAAGSALLSFFIMQARLDVAVSREREVIAQVRAQLSAQKEVAESRIARAEEETSRRCFDNFLADLRVEERHYTKELSSGAATRKAMVLQERLYFRNIPLSNWVEHEMTLEERGEQPKIASTFLPNGLLGSRRGEDASPLPRLVGG